MSTVWLNGEVLPATEARIPALDRGVLWGYGLFETLRAYEDAGGRARAWAFAEHYARLAEGAATIELPIPGPEALEDAMERVLEANDLVEAGVRVTITRGAGPAEPHAEPTESPNVLVTAWPLADYTALYERGVALVTLPGGGRPLAGIKTTSYAASVAGRLLARRAGGDDALFCAGDRALEATGSNLFSVRAAEIRTPPVDGLLPGVTRKKVMEVAHRAGFDVVEAPLRLSDLYRSDEVVLTSSLREVYPVRSIDGRDVPRADVAGRLRRAYGDAVRAAL